MLKKSFAAVALCGLSAMADAQSVSVDARTDVAYTKLADGFDFPVGKAEGVGYYKARGYRANGHQGEDWDGERGGDTDLRDPIYSIGDGVVVLARDVHLGWGNVIIIRSAYREDGEVKTIDTLYGHLDSMAVQVGERVTRGQQIARMGNAHGIYDAHLHLEIRKNLEIGMSRGAFAQDFTNYFDPTEFIQAHRHLSSGGGNYAVATNTFKRDAGMEIQLARNYPARRTPSATEPTANAKKVITFERVTPLDD